MGKISVKNSWNIISRHYQARTRISLDDVHYGPISPGEKELNLLGEVKGKNVLEIGCGGGQNTVVLAKWGAKAAGLDISDEQIMHARKLAEREGVKASFTVGNMEDLSVFGDESTDIVLSSFGVGYVEDIAKTFKEIFRVLRNSGVFVFAEVHPIADRGRVVRYGRKRLWAIANYFDRKRYVWSWRQFEEGKKAMFYGRHRLFQDYFNLLIDSGFQVTRILEPEVYPLDKMTDEEKEEIPYVEAGFVKNYELWKRTPYTVIFKTMK